MSMKITTDKITAWLNELSGGQYLVTVEKLPDPEPPAQATLPDTFRQVQIETMPVGTSGYTMPWALAADENSKLWLDSTYPVFPAVKRTARMKVARYRDGYHVWPPAGEKYTPRQLFGARVPVAKVQNKGEHA